MLLRRSHKRDFQVIRVAKTSEVDPINISATKHKVESLKCGIRARRTVHLSTSGIRLPCTPEEEVRHEIDGHAEYDRRCGSFVESGDIPRLSRLLYSEFCVFDYAMVKFTEADEFVTVWTGRGPRCEKCSRIVSCRGQRLAELNTFLAITRVKTP